MLSLLFYAIKLVGFSYRCAVDESIGFAVSFFGFTCGVGLCEELCKAIPVAFYLRVARQVNWKGASLVGLASGIGFGVSEGVTYASEYYNGIADGLTYLVRFASCAGLHAIWASTVGLVIFRKPDYLATDTLGDQWEPADWFMHLLIWIVQFVLRYLVLVMILHGLYDTLLKKHMEVCALLVAVVSFCWWAAMIYASRSKHSNSVSAVPLTTAFP